LTYFANSSLVSLQEGAVAEAARVLKAKEAEEASKNEGT